MKEKNPRFFGDLWEVYFFSFVNHQAGAVKAFISPRLSWAWPVYIDALLIAGSLMILRTSLRKESTRFGCLVVIGFTGVSVGLNVVHSLGNLISQAVHAISPFALMVSIEMFTIIIRSDLKAGDVASDHVPSSESDFTQPDVPLSRRKVTDEGVFQFFACKTDGTYLNAAEALEGKSQKSLVYPLKLFVKNFMKI